MTDFELRHGDCLDLETGLASLPDDAVDSCLTDPPYDENTHAKGRRGCTGYVEPTRPGATRAQFNRSRELGFSAITQDQMAAVAVQLARVVRRWSTIFCALEMISDWKRHVEAAGLQYIRGGIWHKLGAAPSFVGDRPAVAAEAIVIVHRPGRKRWNRGGGHAFWEYPIVLSRGAEKRRHTTEKPIGLMEALVRDFTEPGELVLDCFSGAGTTGVACRRLGRRFVGWEADEAYATAARARIAETVEQGEMFFKKAKAGKQLGLLGE